MKNDFLDPKDHPWGGGEGGLERSSMRQHPYPPSRGRIERKYLVVISIAGILPAPLITALVSIHCPVDGAPIKVDALNPILLSRVA